MSGLPSEPEMRSVICDGVTGAPSISRILSPGCRPISCAGRPSRTSATTVVGFPPADMSTIAKITTAKARFVAGPAPMATIRFQMGCRQYASSERLSPTCLHAAP